MSLVSPRMAPASCCAALALCCVPVLAQGGAPTPREPASLAASAGQAGAPLPGGRLAGQALLRVWGLEVYQASLWVMPGFRPEAFADHPFALELEYRRAFKAAAIAERSLQEMRRLASFSDEQARRWQLALRQVLADVGPGDRIVGVNRPGQGVRLELNGRLLGELPDPEFARRFFAIWLAPATSEPALRDALLSGLGQG